MRVTITLKRIRITISSKAVGSCESVIADARLLRGGAVLAFFENRCIRSFHRFLKRGQLH